MADHTTYGLVCSELSEDLSKTNLGELKLDSFQDNSVKIKIKAASLNFPDLLMTQGKYQNRPDLPFALGMEGAGIVEKVGSGVSSFKEGDEVMFGGWGHGAIAESIILPESLAKLSGRMIDSAIAPCPQPPNITSSPSLNEETPDPTFSTIPAPSMPRANGRSGLF